MKVQHPPVSHTGGKIMSEKQKSSCDENNKLLVRNHMSMNIRILRWGLQTKISGFWNNTFDFLFYKTWQWLRLNNQPHIMLYFNYWTWQLKPSDQWHYEFTIISIKHFYANLPKINFIQSLYTLLLTKHFNPFSKQTPSFKLNQIITNVKFYNSIRKEI